MSEDLVSETLCRALEVRRPPAGLVIHSDQGSQYTATRFKALDGGSFPSLNGAKLEISHRIAYYNAERRHSALSYLAPSHFESHLQITSQLCSA
jgi:transposase InsO family protein